MASLDAPRLNEREQDLIEAAVLRYRPDLGALLADLLGYERRLSATEGNELRSAVGDALAAEGIDDGAINALGREYDRLIDRVGRITAVFD